MSREIKFRAWDASKGRFVIESAHVHVALTGNVSHCSDSGISNRNDLALQQYTGLKDKNGVEIYTGDILDGYCSQGRVRLGAVEWQQSKLRFYALPRRPLNDADLFERMSCYEVVGNIYENPDLLKAADV